MRLKLKTSPDLSEDSPKHIEAVAQGDDQYRLWTRNVADNLKGKSEDEIRRLLKLTAHPFAVCFEHWIGDFNMGTGIRNANGFNAEAVYYVGDKKWDRRAAVGVHNYTEVQWIPTIEELVSLSSRYTFVGIDNVPGSVPMATYKWPTHPMMIFGEEGTGLTPAMMKLCQDIVHIDMFGSVRSFNCGCASAMAMYDFVNKFRNKS